MSDIRVFRLLETEKLQKHAAVVAEVLFGLRPSAVGTAFTISPGGGWMAFANESRFRAEGTRKGRIEKPLEAREAALRFFAARREAMKNSRAFIESGLPSLIPPDDWLTDAAFDPVPRPRKRRVDHWLCRFGISVRCSDDVDEPRAEVLGAGIDLRIDGAGDVIAADWRWRPAVGHRSHPRLEEPHHEFRIVYRFNDESARQTFLAPYYEVAHVEHHAHAQVLPASDRSLACNIITSEGAGPVRLLAVASGGSGDYAYTWGRISVASFPPVIELLSGARNVPVEIPGRRPFVASQIDFGAEAADVLLQVADNSTGAVIQMRRAIYPSAIDPPAPPELPT